MKTPTDKINKVHKAQQYTSLLIFILLWYCMTALWIEWLPNSEPAKKHPTPLTMLTAQYSAMFTDTTS
jgi:hypothetical protein